LKVAAVRILLKLNSAAGMFYDGAEGWSNRVLASTNGFATFIACCRNKNRCQEEILETFGSALAVRREYLSCRVRLKEKKRLLTMYCFQAGTNA
jgi:hypothetical protein